METMMASEDDLKLQVLPAPSQVLRLQALNHSSLDWKILVGYFFRRLMEVLVIYIRNNLFFFKDFLLVTLSHFRCSIPMIVYIIHISAHGLLASVFCIKNKMLYVVWTHP